MGRRNERRSLPGHADRGVGTPPAALVSWLLDWYRDFHRDLPWRETSDPYRIWVSEIMLQQTRVEAVIPYYQRFLRRFPSVGALAAATRDEVLAHWAGLGYYRRARMLHEAAKRVVCEHDGRWPRDYAAMLRLPGIGEYTAAAVASIAFDAPRAALDGNAWRVLARIADERGRIAAAAPRRRLRALANSLMDQTPPGKRGAFTQALMELGATTCIPRAPRCMACPWSPACRGLAAGTARELPVKAPRRPPRKVELSIAIAMLGDRVLLRRRASDAAIMPGFWELPTAEGPVSALNRERALDFAGPKTLGSFAHAITTTEYTCRAFEAGAKEALEIGYSWVPVAELDTLPLSTISRKALRIATISATGAKDA